MAHLIRQYALESGSLEVEYLEQYFDEFAERKTASQVRQRLSGRDHLVLIALAPSLEDDAHPVPVAFKVGHELRGAESDPQLDDLSRRLRPCVDFARQRIFYSWLGGTRREWRGQGHYRALTEQQEQWAHERGYQQFVVKTKNRFHRMRATLDSLGFDILRFEPDAADNANSKVYLHKRLTEGLLRAHLTQRAVTETA